MEEKVALFLSLFNRVKNETNNSPRNLSWLAKERPSLQDLCYELQSKYQSLAKIMATKSSKHSFITTPFENEWKEYELNYSKHVAKAAEPAEERSVVEFQNSLQEGEQSWLESGKTKEQYWEHVNEWIAKLKPTGSSFDPLNDNPASLMQSIHDFLHDAVGGGFFDDDFYDSALGAWYFFEKSIGLDFDGIYRRWRNSPELFIPLGIQHTNTFPLIELYNEAVRAYAFGNRVASIAMCRALMEHILQKYYGLKAKDLEGIIALAEQRFPNLKKLHMQAKRKLGNDILHDYENKSEVEDRAVIQFLNTIKYLVQNVDFDTLNWPTSIL
ncbi:MAG: DUF4145 domain-containing protein [Syntrophobacteraceae bacterium]